MPIECDDRDARQARLEWMRNEFQHARQRRLVKTDVRTVESEAKADTNAALAQVTARQTLEATVVDDTNPSGERHLVRMNSDTRARIE
jgi:hypothetical protein